MDPPGDQARRVDLVRRGIAVEAVRGAPRGRGGRVGIADRRMRVQWDLVGRQRDGLHAVRLTDRVRRDAVAALMYCGPAGQVRQRERALAVAAVGCPYHVEKGLVLGDRQQLAVARHPPGGGEVAPEHAYLAYIGLTHRVPFRSLTA